MDNIQFQLYNLPDGNGSVQVYVEGETIWLTQKAMAELFGVDRSVVTKHLKISLKVLNFRKIQYVQNLHILPLTVRLTKHLSIISMPSSVSAIG